ncbi:DinB family protein [Fodinibius saliphilus]|uniref:DinB family protein n=1 Tax=Fodinibius saliphilus TaxID=1920650 RepID=UPI00110954C8|nr:DinB family protein [Fodinibius saliphilus]
MEKPVLRRDLKENTQTLLKTISYFSADKFNTVPPNGGWSAAQVCQHLILVDGGAVRLLTAEGREIDRKPGDKIPVFKKRMHDFETKMNATDPITPDGNPKDKEQMLGMLQDIRQRMTSLIEAKDLTKLVVTFEHPFFGALTRLEWIVFSIHHSQRHIYQLKKIASAI